MYEITNLVYLRQKENLHEKTGVYLEFIIIAKAIISDPNNLKRIALKTKMSRKKEKEERE